MSDRSKFTRAGFIFNSDLSNRENFIIDNDQRRGSMKKRNKAFYHICGFIYYYLDIKVINDSMNFSNQLLSVISTFNLSCYQTSRITIELNKKISLNRIKILMKKKILRNSRMTRIFSIVWKLEVKCIGINRKNRVHQWLSLKTHFNPNHCQSIKMDIWSKRFEVVEQIDRVCQVSYGSKAIWNQDRNPWNEGFAQRNAAPAAGQWRESSNKIRNLEFPCDIEEAGAAIQSHQLALGKREWKYKSGKKAERRQVLVKRHLSSYSLSYTPILITYTYAYIYNIYKIFSLCSFGRCIEKFRPNSVEGGHPLLLWDTSRKEEEGESVGFRLQCRPNGHCVSV